MNSKQVHNKPSGKGFNLPEPDRENIGVLADNLPNKPILPWHHYDSPWHNKEEEILEESEAAEEAEPICQEQLLETEKSEVTDELAEDDSEQPETEALEEELDHEQLTETEESEVTDELAEDDSEQPETEALEEELDHEQLTETEKSEVTDELAEDDSEQPEAQALEEELKQEKLLEPEESELTDNSEVLETKELVNSVSQNKLVIAKKKLENVDEELHEELRQLG